MNHGKIDVSTFKYGGVTYSAHTYTDTVCIEKANPKTCTASQKVLGVISEPQPFNNFEGMVGLNKESQFLANLKLTGNYKKLFALHLGSGSNQSHITFGGADTAYMEDPKATVAFIPGLNVKYDWSINTDAIMLGKTSLDAKASKTSIVAEYNGIMIPSDDFTKLTKEI